MHRLACRICGGRRRGAQVVDRRRQLVERGAEVVVGGHDGIDGQAGEDAFGGNRQICVQIAQSLIGFKGFHGKGESDD